jgi:hypothetical protein
LAIQYLEKQYQGNDESRKMKIFSLKGDLRTITIKDYENNIEKYFENFQRLLREIELMGETVTEDEKTMCFKNGCALVRSS